MKTFAAVLAFGAAAYAQGLSDIPSCALSCLSAGLSSDGCSGLTDYACHCKNTELIPQVQPCVQKDCPAAASQSAVASALEAICASVSVPITIEVPGATSAAETSAAETSAAETSAAESSSSAAETTSAESTAEESSAASTPAPTASATVTASASPSATTTDTSLVGTGTVITNPTANGTVISPSSPTQYEGAAAQVTQAAAVLGLAFAAVVAL